MSINALNSALSGLKVAQHSLDATSRNIANVTTEGYTRKYLPVQSVFEAGQQIGVRFGDLQRNVSSALQRDYWNQISTTSGLATGATYLDRIQTLHGAPEDESSVAADITRLSNTFQQLVGTPESTILHGEAVTAARNVAGDLNRLSASLNTLRNDTQKDISGTVATINTSLKNIAKLNQSIATEMHMGRSGAGLMDQRDLAVKALAEQVDISFFTRGDGVLVVQTASGRLLADDQPHELHFSPTPLDPGLFHPASVAGVYLDRPLTGPDLASEQLGGRLGALLELRDRTFPQQQAQADELAHKLAQRFDAQGLRLFTDETGAVPADVAGGYVGFASRIQVNAAVEADPSLIRDGTAGPAGAAGSSALIRKVLDFALGAQQSDAPPAPHAPFRTTGLGPNGGVATGLPAEASIVDYARNLIARQSEAHSNTQSELGFQTGYRENLEKRLLDSSGVDLDQEVAKMQELQAAYAASAKMISTLQELFDQLLAAIR